MLSGLDFRTESYVDNLLSKHLPNNAEPTTNLLAGMPASEDNKLYGHGQRFRASLRPLAETKPAQNKSR